MKTKKYIIYKIINKLNNMIYIGCHVTENITDKYMGSGTNIKKAIKQYGLENFDKYILYQFDNEFEMLEKEAELVNREFISDVNNYNIIVGGNNFLTLDTVSVVDKDGNCFRVHKNDDRYLSGELISTSKGYFLVRDIYDNILFIKSTDERYLSGELIANGIGYVTVKDKNNNYFRVSKYDQRYLSGELLPMWTNKKHNDETKRKIGEKNSIHQIGEKNSRFGTCWITKEGKNKSIKKDELDIYLKDSWIKGRKI